MNLPQDFYFTQAKLEDYLTCRRRFYWRYIAELPYPALVAEPARDFERLGRNGGLFHQAVRQVLTGIPPQSVQAVIQESEVRHWLENFLRYAYPLLHPLQRVTSSLIQTSEALATVQIAGHRLMAKYDFVSISEGGKAQIWDWKTSRTLPAFHVLEARMQSVVYPLVLALGGYREGIAPENIEMIYWFANFPLEAVRIPYNQEKLKRDTERLTQWMQEIIAAPEGHFGMTEDERHCNFCVYRSLCARGEKAGIFTDEAIERSEETWLVDLDFEQILEIEF